jgi:hypothetical protein
MSIQVFVLSHDHRLLADVPRVPGLTTVDLEDLGLPARLSGQELSETRFFLTDFLSGCDAEWIGLITGRWNDKFRCWPSLAQLPSFVAAHMRRPVQVIAPATFWWPAADLKRFATRLDARYPGMGRMLEDPGAPAVTAVRSSRLLHPLVFNNNVIAHRDLVVAWIDFIRASFAYYDQRYGQTSPSTCAATSAVPCWWTRRVAGCAIPACPTSRIGTRPTSTNRSGRSTSSAQT